MARELVMESGFSPSADADLVTTLMRAGDIPAIAALADGFTLSESARRPRSRPSHGGEQVAERSSQTYLYHP